MKRIRFVMAVLGVMLSASCTAQTQTSPEPSPTPGPSSDDPGATMDDPLAIGESARLGDWEIWVVRFTPDVDEIIERIPRPYNHPAREGYQYARVTLRVRNLSSIRRDPFGFIRSWIVVPATGVRYHRAPQLQPRDLSYIEWLPPGKGRIGNVVYQVRQSDISETLVAEVQTRGGTAFFALD